jgi:N-acetylglucosamine-6-phosphate deacetylase
MRIQARHYATGEPIEILCERGTIRSIQPPSSTPPDVQGGWIAPPFFDLQINGCGGRSFNSEHLTVEMVHEIVTTCLQHGIGGFCPAVVTNGFPALLHGLTTVSRACEDDTEVARAIPAIHLEGPYISPEDGPRGAHPRQHVRPANWDEFRRLQDTSGGRIRLVTLAPEQAGGLEFIEALVRTGVVAAIGHTAANCEQIRNAIAAGARLSTHLGNGAHSLLPRHDNYIWEQLAADDLWASIICDGHHLPPAVVRCFLRVKTPARTILTCDAGSLAGMPPGLYREWGQELDVLPAGKIVVAGTDYLAGSWSFTDVCIANAIRFAGVSLGDAVDMACVRPRELLGLPTPRLLPGEPADMVVFDWQEGGNLAIRATILGGGVQYESAK